MQSQSSNINILAACALRLERGAICALALLSMLIGALLPAIANGANAHSGFSFDLSICRGQPGEEDRQGEHGPLSGLACVCAGICANHCSVGLPTGTLHAAANIMASTTLYALWSAGAELLMRGPAFPTLRGPPNIT